MAPGSLVANRALVRWAWRLLRREWRMQMVLLSLLAVAVAAAVLAVTVAYNVDSPAGRFGSADHLLVFDGGAPTGLRAGLAATKARFMDEEVIGNREVRIPGSVEEIDLRTQSPRGRLGRQLLGLREGRFPAADEEVAVTPGVAHMLHLQIGSPLDLAGRARSVVGIVENPQDLRDQFVLAPPGSARAEFATVLLDAAPRTFESFRQSLRGPARAALVDYRDRSDRHNSSASVTFAVASSFLLLVVLIAASGFAMVARRRLRQLGMLAAVGATERQLQLVAAANGATVGAVAALPGAIAGIAIWTVLAPALESAVHHRIDPLHLPGGWIALVLFMVVSGAGAAAWWPGRALARLPIGTALSGRPPRPARVRRSALLGGCLIAVGFAALVASQRSSAPLLLAGLLGTIGGALLITPLAVGLLASCARPMPVAIRLAFRDLGRYRARSSAAVSLALGIAAAVVLVSNAEAGKIGAQTPNLSSRQIRVYPGPAGLPDFPTPRTAPEIEHLSEQVRHLARGIPGSLVTPLSVAVEPGVAPQGSGADLGIPTMQISRGSGSSYSTASVLYVATPKALRYLDLDPRSIEPGTDFLISSALDTSGLFIPSAKSRKSIAIDHFQRVHVPSLLLGFPDVSNQLSPPSFVTVGALRRLGWREASSGWLIEARHPLSGSRLATVRAFAARAGLTIETRRAGESLGGVIAAAIAAAALLASGILLLTVGLIRSESAADLRTLAAVGAEGRTRRTLAAASAGGLALMGTLLGIAGAYVTLLAVFLGAPDYLGHLPLSDLAVMLFGVPAFTAVASWLAGGREPPALGSTAIE